MKLDKVPPHDLDVERAVLGAMMLEPEAMDIGYDILGSGDAFYSERHRKIYQAMLELYRRRDNVDLLTVSNQLLNMGVREEIGGAVYLTDLVRSIPTSANIRFHAQILKGKAILRDYIKFAIELKQAAYTSVDIDSDISEWERRFFEISRRIGKDEFDLHRTFDATWNKIGDVREGNSEAGYSWGMPDIDKVLLIRPKEMIVLAALKKSGKSKFLVYAIYAIVKQNVPVLFFSLEMSKEKVMRWLMSHVNRLNSKHLASGRLNDSEFEKIHENRPLIVDYDITIDDRGGLNTAQIFSTTRRWVAQKGSGGVVAIDFLQLIDMQRERGQNEASVIKNTCFELVNMAKELNVAVILLSQLRNEAENEPFPTLRYLEGSGGIAQAAEAIVLLDNKKRTSKRRDKEQMSNREIDFIVDAQRDGESGVLIPLYAELEYGNFTVMEKVHDENEVPDEL